MFQAGLSFEPSDSMPFGDSESGTGRNSLLQEWPERIRAGSEDSGHGLDLKLNQSRRSSEVQFLQSKFEFEQSPHGSSIISHRSRLASVGEMDLSNHLPGIDAEEDESIFKDQSLQEEPDTQLQSQISSHQV